MRSEIKWENAEYSVNESIFYYFMNERKYCQMGSIQEQKY